MLRRLMLVGVLAVALAAGACTTSPEPFEYESDNETRQGRGVFTGEEGSWTILRREMPAEAADPESAAKSEAQAGAEAQSPQEGQAAPASADSE